APLRIVARMSSGERPPLARVSATVPRELRDRPDLTAALDREIARATNPDPTQRHESIREFWDSVEPKLRDASSRGVASSVDDPASFDGAGPAASAGPSAPPSSSLRPEWRMIGRPMTGERLRASVLTPDGRTIVAV